ncbi:proline--tRNA ligase [Magnetovibrio sp. PR-2]|uniref:proline--tRNA ligase n=1 Tax=Magnetovibrio sp. PR-2 TaxID=3120356 RepID=UPI002FCDFB2B
MSQKPKKTAIRITRENDFPKWYQEVIKEADMAENSGVRGCMVIKPWGFGIWENLQRRLDQRIRETGHQNCYFPLFIPLELIEKEAAHVEGFAKEMAVVTHHRLVAKDGKLEPAGELESPLVVRPTSETMIGESFAKWVRSYRDLPVMINQWANVVRWEMRPRLFLRTSEFLWQEGHTAHATEQEARDETATMLEEYRKLAEDWLAVPVIPGEKSESERFPGAVETHTIEAMMQDGKALQAGTSHYLGQNFAHAADIKFQDKDGGESYCHTTSWGVSTRMIGAVIMTHGDDDGLRVPPTIAPYQIVILPIARDDEAAARVLPAAQELADKLNNNVAFGNVVRAHVDKRDMNAGEKRWSWIKKGAPIVVELGPRDLDQGSVMVTERTDVYGKGSQDVDAFVAGITDQLGAIQQKLFEEAKAFRDARVKTDIEDFEAFKAYFANETFGETGFVRAYWCESAESEEMLKDLGVTIRCLPYDQPEVDGACVLTGAAASKQAIFAKSY